MDTDTYTGPPREGERYATEAEFEAHMNTRWKIPGARWAIYEEVEIGDPYADLVIPADWDVPLVASQMYDEFFGEEIDAAVAVDPEGGYASLAMRLCAEGRARA